MAAATTPWQDRAKAWVLKWISIGVFGVLLYLLLDAWASGGLK